MKKVSLLFIFSFISLSALAQESYRFELKIEPNKTYRTQMETSSDGVIDFIVSDEIKEQMEANGMESPMKMQQETNMTMVSKTEGRNSAGNIPASMTYENIISKMSLNGNPMPQEQPLDGMQILGYYDNENKYNVDSIIGDAVTDQIKTVLIKTLESIQKQVSFPEENIEIGSSFENEIPMTIPMQGMNPMNIVIKSKFTLTEVKDNIAYFDTLQDITLDSTQEQMNMTATGTGEGTCEFDMNQSYLTKYKSELPMVLSMKANDLMSIKMNMDTKTSTLVTIE